MAVTYNKDGAYIEITENGVTYRRAIRLEDGVVSLVDPDGTNKKVDLVRVNASDQLVLVLEDESVVTVTGGAGGVGDMLKSVYDTDDDGTVEDSDKLEGSTKAQVQDHTPKAHTLASHSTKAHSELTGVTISQHHTKYTDAEAVAAAKAALDYGLSFEGVVTTATDETHFKVSTLAGKGTGFFIPNTGDPYEIYVVQADGAAPEGLHTPVLAYTSADGTFQHADFVTGDLEVGDVVLIMHPWLAFIKDILTDTGTTIPGTITTLQGNVSTILGRITAAVALASVLEDAMQKASPNYNQDTDSLEALRELLDTIAGDVANIDGSSIPAMVGTDGAALASAWSAALATILGNFSSTNIGYLDNLSAGAAALEATLTAIKGTTWSDETLKAIKDAVDAINGGYTHTDWKGNFNWDTSVNTTDETDISTLFSTDLELTTRRKYTVRLDLAAVEADGNFDELYIAVKEKVNPASYGAEDRKTVTKANLAATAEPVIIIVIPATADNVQITMQMKTALAGDATIYYAVVREHLE